MSQELDGLKSSCLNSFWRRYLSAHSLLCGQRHPDLRLSTISSGSSSSQSEDKTPPSHPGSSSGVWDNHLICFLWIWRSSFSTLHSSWMTKFIIQWGPPQETASTWHPQWPSRTSWWVKSFWIKWVCLDLEWASEGLSSKSTKDKLPGITRSCRWGKQWRWTNKSSPSRSAALFENPPFEVATYLER